MSCLHTLRHHEPLASLTACLIIIYMAAILEHDFIFPAVQTREPVGKAAKYNHFYIWQHMFDSTFNFSVRVFSLCRNQSHENCAAMIAAVADCDKSICCQWMIAQKWPQLYL